MMHHFLVEILHRAADLTLVTSSVLGKELQGAGAAAGRFQPNFPSKMTFLYSEIHEKRNPA